VAPVAQGIEHRFPKPRVAGSNPAGGILRHKVVRSTSVPLLDHFRPPLHPQRHWESFHANWAGAMADVLNEELLPEGYFAEEEAHSGGRIEIDVATFESAAPPAPALSTPGVFPDSFEVQIFRSEGGATLVAAIELISPANKHRQ